MNEELGTLPALKGLGRLADMRPTIVVDSREQTPLPILHLPFVIAGLQTGDYSVQGCEEKFMVERKSLGDLVGCCMGENRERFERELHRARGFNFARLLVIATDWEISQAAWHSKITPRAVRATLAAFEARYIPIVFAATPETGGELVEKWAWWYCREVVQSANDLLRGSVPPATTP